MTGGTSHVNTPHFSQPVVDSVIAIYSVGRVSTPVTFNFLDDPSFVIASQGAGYWGGGSLTQSGNSVTGLEGNGLLQFTGSYTDIAFTTPDSESYYGFTRRSNCHGSTRNLRHAVGRFLIDGFKDCLIRAWATEGRIPWWLFSFLAFECSLLAEEKRSPSI